MEKDLLEELRKKSDVLIFLIKKAFQKSETD